MQLITIGGVAGQMLVIAGANIAELLKDDYPEDVKHISAEKVLVLPRADQHIGYLSFRNHKSNGTFWLKVILTYSNGELISETVEGMSLLDEIMQIGIAELLND